MKNIKNLFLVAGMLVALPLFLVACGNNDGGGWWTEFWTWVNHKWFWCYLAASLCLTVGAHLQSKSSKAGILSMALSSISAIALCVFMIMGFWKFPHWWYVFLISFFFGGIYNNTTPAEQEQTSTAGAIIGLIFNIAGTVGTVLTYVWFYTM